MVFDAAAGPGGAEKKMENKMLKFLFGVVLAASLNMPDLLSAETIGIWPNHQIEQDRSHDADRTWRRGHGNAPMIAPPVVVEPRFEAPPERRWFKDRRSVPTACLRRFDTRYGPQSIYGTPCLQEWSRLARFLPESCHVRIMTHVGVRDGYDPACLRAQGYRSAR